MQVSELVLTASRRFIADSHLELFYGGQHTFTEESQTFGRAQTMRGAELDPFRAAFEELIGLLSNVIRRAGQGEASKQFVRNERTGALKVVSVGRSLDLCLQLRLDGDGRIERGDDGEIERHLSTGQAPCRLCRPRRPR